MANHPKPSAKNAEGEYAKFESFMKRLVAVPHSEIKKEPDAEKTYKKRNRLSAFQPPTLQPNRISCSRKDRPWRVAHRLSSPCSGNVCEAYRHRDGAPKRREREGAAPFGFQGCGGGPCVLRFNAILWFAATGKEVRTSDYFENRVAEKMWILGT